MTDLLAKYGVNAEIRENASGDVILRNSTTGTEIRLADFIEFASALGTEANPVPGTSHLESLSTEDLKYKKTPPGAVVELDGTQSIATDTITTVEWAAASRDPDNLLNPTNNSVTVPSGFSYARVGVSLWWSSQVSLSSLSIRFNNIADIESGFRIFESNMQLRGTPNFTTGWVPVAGGDEITTQLEHTSGSDKSLRDDPRTNMEVWLI